MIKYHTTEKVLISQHQLKFDTVNLLVFQTKINSTKYQPWEENLSQYNISHEHHQSDQSYDCASRQSKNIRKSQQQHSINNYQHGDHDERIHIHNQQQHSQHQHNNIPHPQQIGRQYTNDLEDTTINTRMIPSY